MIFVSSSKIKGGISFLHYKAKKPIQLVRWLEMKDLDPCSRRQLQLFVSSLASGSVALSASDFYVINKRLFISVILHSIENAKTLSCQKIDIFLLFCAFFLTAVCSSGSVYRLHPVSFSRWSSLTWIRRPHLTHEILSSHHIIVVQMLNCFSSFTCTSGTPSPVFLPIRVSKWRSRRFIGPESFI